MTRVQRDRPFDLAATARYFDRAGSVLRLANALDQLAYDRFAALADLRAARQIFELGPGLGSLARGTLRGPSTIENWLLADASVRLCNHLQHRIAQRDTRAKVFHVTSGPPFPFPSASFDRFVACFVLDCMDTATQAAYLSEAWRLLKPGGTLCTMSVTRGTTPLSTLVMGLGNLLASITPALALGARFVELAPSIRPEDWDVRASQTCTSMGMTTHLLVASRRASYGH